VSEAVKSNTGLRLGVNVARGEITNATVAEAFGERFTEPEKVLGGARPRAA
jgi:alanine dehydrogenase